MRRRTWRVGRRALAGGALVLTLASAVAWGPGVAGAGQATAGVLFRPVLCAVPPLDKFITTPQPALSAASCGSSRLTAASMQVTLSKGSPGGYTYQVPPPEIILEAERTTKPAHDAASAVVLLGGLRGSSVYSGTPTSKSIRFVLGPAVMTSADIASATATQTAKGRWTVAWTTTSAGARAWDRAARASFHRLLAVDVGGVVVSAPIIEPTQQKFTSFHGQGQVSGDWTQAEAQKIAAALQPGG